MPKRPNVILIVADDMGYGDFGVFNDSPARTPHLDALVGEGVCLTQHYAGSPACSPSRAALLTGRYPHRTGALTPMEVRGMDRIALDEVTELMSEPDPEMIIPPPADLELYNIDDDPLEQNNMASSEPERASRMLGALEGWFEGVEPERRRIQPDGSILEIVDE